MQISIYFVDAFTDKIFHGNPAAVCVLSKWLTDDLLHAIARENNQPVTAFLVQSDDKFDIRWITPEYELELCGHGLLAASFVIFNDLLPTLQSIDLRSRNEMLQVNRFNDFIQLNFSEKSIENTSHALLEEGLGLVPQEIYQHATERLLAVCSTEDEVKHLSPNWQILKKLEHRGITVTAPGAKVDFVSRTFYPHKNIPEDSVTGAAHCFLVPYWSKKLNKQDLHALQISHRGGELFCRYENDRVFIKGKAVLYLQGSIHI